MCSFLITSWVINNLAYINYFMQRRGPDATSHVRYGAYSFVHNLLHMTGDRLIQPLSYQDNQVQVIFNGEIYNYEEIDPKAKSDGEAIYTAYNKFGGTRFASALDGEFAVVVIRLLNLFVLNCNYSNVV